MQQYVVRKKKRKKKKKRFSDACNLSENYNITLMAMRGIIRRGISHDSVVLNGLTEMFVCVNGFFFHSVRIVHSKCAAPGQSNNHCLRQHIQRAKTIASIWWDRKKKREKKISNLSKNPADYSFNKKVLLVLNNNQAIWNMYGPWCAYTRFVIAVGLDLFI